MGVNTKIEWTDSTWSPVTGCSHAGSPGCDHCYAKRMAQRLKGRYGYPKDDPFKVTFHPDKLDQPLRWRKPRRIFVVSMGDLFHKDVKGDWMWRILDAAWDSPSYHRHTYIFLTKRPERMADEMDNWMQQHTLSSLPKRWWLGVTAESQQTADERIPILLQIPAAVKYVSIEPMLGEIDLKKYIEKDLTNKIDWCIIGAENAGSKSREMKNEWVRKVVRQCKKINVSVFYKQQIVDGKRITMPLLDGKQYAEFPQTINKQSEL